MALKSIALLQNYIKYVFPEVDHELYAWKRDASSCPDRVLSSQAIASIELKGFHAKGGSVFALYPGCDVKSQVRLITAYQTICDYLDNLCDRAGIMDEKAFMNLHLSLTDALSPEGTVHDYYKYYKYKDDGGYLNRLIETCRDEIIKLPSYNIVRVHIMQLASYYSILQSYKHLPVDKREKKLLSWAKPKSAKYNAISQWEFCAGTGSTLGIFSLFAASSRAGLSPSEAQKILGAYFPSICSLHILLDYFIDYYEDIEHGDLNFIGYYKNITETSERLDFFIKSSLSAASGLQYYYFHKTVIYGMLSMYLSDPKAYQERCINETRHIISSHGLGLRIMHLTCRKLREHGRI